MREYPSELDRKVSEAVILGMFRTQMRQRDVAAALGMSVMSLSRRLNGQIGWTMAEAETVYTLLELPRLDSNQQPADYRPGDAA